MADRTPPVIQVRSLRNRYGFDGQTGVLTLKGTTGTVGAMTLQQSTVPSRMGPGRVATMRATLTVYWDACIIQDAENNDPSNYEGFEESDVNPDDVEFVRAYVEVGK